MVTWTLGFETPDGHPVPYFEIHGSGDYVLGFAASVIPNGWTLTTVNYRSE